MVNFTEPVDPSQFATATEVDGIRRTLDEFMKTQDQVNQSIKDSLNKILQRFSTTPQSGIPLPEDKGSSMKGKGQPAQPPPIPFHHAQSSNWHNHQPPAHPQFRHANPYLHMPPDEASYYAMYHHPSQHNWSTQGQYVFGDEYGEEGFDYDQDWQDHPWNIPENAQHLVPHNIPPQYKQPKPTNPPHPPITLPKQPLQQQPPNTTQQSATDGEAPAVYKSSL